MASALDRGRAAFEQRAWGEAARSLMVAADLGGDDLERLAIAAYLAGMDDQSAIAWRRGHDAWLAAGDRERAARCAFWLGFVLTLAGQMAKASGWQARGERLVERAPGPSVARGLLMAPVALGALQGGDLVTAAAGASAMVELGDQTGDHDLSALGILLSGQVAIADGRIADGMQHLDEVMVRVSTREVSPIAAGIVYCAVIEACMDVHDLRRAAEWTDELDEWCSTQPDLVPYRGQCLVHRSQVLQAHGSWDDARTTITSAAARLSEPAHPALGLALHQSGDLYRLRGELGLAEQAYREASRHGEEPVPGLALLRLAEGHVEAARAAVARLLIDAEGRHPNIAVLAAAVDIFLAAGDGDRARLASESLARAAEAAPMPLLDAIAAFAAGSVRLADGDPGGALSALRQAEAAWRALGMPYEVARSRVQAARACLALGDAASAELELDAAKAMFERLGAQPDLQMAEQLGSLPAGGAIGLTGRECEVLRLVAAGGTNRDIAAALHISGHTVARHLQNIYVKLGINSRSSATAYAYEHHLV